jgi:hypothetical protein
MNEWIQRKQNEEEKEGLSYVTRTKLNELEGWKDALVCFGGGGSLFTLVNDLHNPSAHFLSCLTHNKSRATALKNTCKQTWCDNWTETASWNEDAKCQCLK